MSLIGHGARYFASAPDNPAGIATSYRGTGRLRLWATDSDWPGVKTRVKADDNPSGPWLQWQANDTTIPDARRIAAVNLQNNAEQFFVVTASGSLKTRKQTRVDGAWTAWSTMATPTGLKDIAATGSSGVITQIYALGENNQVYTQYKLGDAISDWSAWCSLGIVNNARSLAVVRFGSVQQLFVTSLTDGIQTKWTTANACNTFGAFGSFATGSFAAITAGILMDGRVHVVVSTTGGTTQHSIRAADGSAWSPLDSFGSGNTVNSTGFTRLASGRLQDGREQIFAVASNGEVYETWQFGSGFANWVRSYM